MKLKELQLLFCPVTADLLEQENAAKLATANTIVDAELINTIRTSEQVVE